MKVGKEENFGGLTADGAFLGVLPCSDWMLGPRICSATCIVDGLLKIAVLVGLLHIFLGLFFLILGNGIH